MRRRTYIAAAGSGILALAGCTGANSPTTGGPATDDTTTGGPTTDDPTTGGSETTGPDDGRLTDWTRSTDCDGMQDSVVKVEWTTSSVDEAYAPIHFSALTEGEQAILETVVEEGGYGTCEVTDAFRQFVERVSDHRGRQESDEIVYLEYDGEFYGLYVEQQDMVFSMG